MPETVAQAIKAAEDRQAEYLDVQYRALHADPEDQPGPGDVLAAGKAFELAQGRVEIARKREQAAKEAERREALAALGQRIDVFYSETASSRTLEVLARQVSEAVAALRAGVSAHNGRVDAYMQEAASLETRRGERGPRAEDAFVGHVGDGIRHANNAVQKVGSNALEYAVGHAVRGDLKAALGELVITHDHTPAPVRAVYRDTLGQFPPDVLRGDARPSRALAEDIRSGRWVAMTEDEVELWKAGAWQRPPW